MTATAEVTAIAPWYGCKRTLAPRIVERFPKHRLYYEPFCGSLAVFMAKPRSPMEMLNDRHGDVVNLARVLADRSAGAAFYRQARRLICSQLLFDEAKEACVARQREPAPPGPDVDRAIEFFTYSWLGRNGVVGSNGDFAFCVRYTANGGSPAKRYRSAIDSIPAWRERLRDAIVLNNDAFLDLPRIDDDDGTVIYADPPYMVKGSKYLHDFEAGDHKRLADALGRFRRATVVVSYYDHPRIREIYPSDHWDIQHVPVAKTMVKAGQRGGGENPTAPEVLIVNRNTGVLF